MTLTTADKEVLSTYTAEELLEEIESRKTEVPGISKFLQGGETMYSAHRPIENLYTDPTGARPLQEASGESPALAIISWIKNNQTRIIPGEWIFYLANQFRAMSS